MARPKERMALRKTKKPRTKMKPRKWRDALNALATQCAYEDLKKIEGQAPREKASDERRWIPVAELVVAENVFQWRSEHSDLHAEELHMRELMRTLELGQNLEPIVVITLRKKSYVVDGHHRLAAYAALGKTKIPVTHFKGDLRAAFFKSLDTNIRDKLPITRKDKWEAAFRLVKHKLRYGLTMTWEEITRRAVVSERLVYKMQAVLGKNPDAWEWSWAKTLGKIQNVDADYQPGTDEYRDEYARKMADQIMAKVSMNLTANPDITARALAMISEGLPHALIEEWRSDAMEVLLEQARAADSEEAEGTLRLAFAQLESAMAQATEL
jgi:hypothetical protein